jgi:hypothetical protein
MNTNRERWDRWRKMMEGEMEGNDGGRWREMMEGDGGK